LGTKERVIEPREGNMAVTTSKGHFRTREEATEEANTDGLWTLDLEQEPGHAEETHWHDFDIHIYVLSGSLNLMDTDSGRTFKCTGGDKAVIPCRALHSAQTDTGMKYIAAISIDPSKIEQPVNRSPSEL
jgi:quercetin dioxygenase-like cupin family protein